MFTTIYELVSRRGVTPCTQPVRSDRTAGRSDHRESPTRRVMVGSPGPGSRTDGGSDSIT
eukprot:576448-Hanusia_phi.AAC.1